MTPHRQQRFGATAIQLLVVLAVLLLLLGLLLPAVQRVREAAARAQSTNNLRQMALAMHNFHDTFKGFPPGAGEFQNKSGSTHFFILPFIEQNDLFQRTTDGPWDKETWTQPVQIYLDPRDSSAPPGNVYQGWLATTNYAVNWMVTGEGPQLKSLVQITDGTSNTLMFAQRFQLCNGAPTAWGYPGQYAWAPTFAFYNQSLFQVPPSLSDCDPQRPQAIGGAMLVAMCDGSARTVNPQCSAVTWANVCGPADGQVIGNDF
jgi:hypothetical protein